MVCENGLSTQVIIELAKKEEVDIVLDWSKYLHKEQILDFKCPLLHHKRENQSSFDQSETSFPNW